MFQNRSQFKNDIVTTSAMIQYTISYISQASFSINFDIHRIMVYTYIVEVVVIDREEQVRGAIYRTYTFIFSDHGTPIITESDTHSNNSYVAK